MKPPYYAVIFTSVRTEFNEGYEDMAKLMVQLAQEQEGFIGVESARNEIGITVSYWKDLESIRNWKQNTDSTEKRA
jgi:heme-degrading monooxygenase HmoA